MTNSIAQKAAMSGNLRALTSDEQWQYYLAMCDHLGLDPVSRPFDWIDQEGKLSLYPNANCAAQLAQKGEISFPEYATEMIGEVFVYRVRATSNDERELWATGAVPVGRTALETARAIKKAETQARRRAVFALGGLALTEAEEMYEVGARSYVPDDAIEQSVDAEAPGAEKAEKAVKAVKKSRAPKSLPAAPTESGESNDAATRKEAESAQDTGAASDAAIAAAKQTAWAWMKKAFVATNDAILIWKTLNGSLDAVEEFLKIFPAKVPVVIGADDALKIFQAHDLNAEKSLPHITEYGRKIAEAIAGPTPVSIPPAPMPTLPKEIIETFNLYEIAEAERHVVWTFFNGVTLDNGGPFSATEDFLMFRTSKDVPASVSLTDLLSIWRDTDGHLRKAKQAVAELLSKPKADDAWHGGIVKANRDLSADTVGLDATPVWKWIKSIPLDGTKENRTRIGEIMAAHGSDWSAVIADIKREFSA